MIYPPIIAFATTTKMVFLSDVSSPHMALILLCCMMILIINGSYPFYQSSVTYYVLLEQLILINPINKTKNDTPFFIR